MQKTNRIKMIILIALAMLSGCKIPEYRVMNRCVYSVQFDLCACQEYDLNSLEPITEMKETDLAMCDDLIGFNVFDWTDEITPKGREIYNWVNDNCSTNRN